MDFPHYSAGRGLKAGALGGLVGALVLGVLAGVSSFVLGDEVFYVQVAAKLGLIDPSVTGWVLHFIVGLVAGALFIAATSMLRKFAIDTTKKAFWVGLAGGIAVWALFYVPVTDLFAPTYLSDLMLAGGSLLFHLVYGVVTTVVSLSLIRRGLRTKTTRENLSAIKP